MPQHTPARPRDVDTSLLRAWPLPVPSNDADKEGRGHVLVLGGSREMPGAVILAATAATCSCSAVRARCRAPSFSRPRRPCARAPAS